MRGGVNAIFLRGASEREGKSSKSSILIKLFKDDSDINELEGLLPSLEGGSPSF